MIKRFDDWPTLLYDYNRKMLDEPFVWGEHDCALFPCNCVREYTGVDFAEPFRKKYKTKIGAARVLKEYSGGGLKETAEQIAKENSLEEVPRAFVQRGDVLLLDSDEDTIMGILDTASLPLTVGLNGLRNYPTERIIKAWRIG